MARGLAEIDWEDPTEYAPGGADRADDAVHLLDRDGIAFGFIAYAG